MSYAVYSFNVQTKKGKQKYSIEASPSDMLGEVFVDIVKGSQSTDFPISVKRSDGSDIEWRFHIVDGSEEIQEVFPDQSLQQNSIQNEQLIYAYDDSDIGSRSPIMISRKKKAEEESEEGSEDEGYAPSEDLATIEMSDGDWMADVVQSQDPGAAANHALMGGPKFPHAIHHHMGILGEVLQNNADWIVSNYDWSLLETWGYKWNEVPISIFGVQGMIGMFEGEPLLGDSHTVKIVIPTSFPDSRPKVVPVTPLWHPNIRPETDTEEGDICWIGQWTGDELNRCLERLLANVIEIIQYAKVRGGDHARMNEQARDWLIERFGGLMGYEMPHPPRLLRRAAAEGPAIRL